MLFNKKELVKLGLIAVAVGGLAAGCNSGDSGNKSGDAPASVSATSTQDVPQNQDQGKTPAAGEAATVSCFNVTNAKGEAVDASSLSGFPKLQSEIALLASVDGATVSSSAIDLMHGSASVLNLSVSGASATVASSSSPFSASSIAVESSTDTAKQENMTTLHFVLNETVEQGCETKAPEQGKPPKSTTQGQGQGQNQGQNQEQQQTCKPTSSSEEVNVSLCLNVVPAKQEQSQEQKAPEQKAPEQKAPEQKAPEQKAPEQKAPEQKAPEQKAPEQKAPEQSQTKPK